LASVDRFRRPGADPAHLAPALRGRSPLATACPPRSVGLTRGAGFADSRVICPASVREARRSSEPSDEVRLLGGVLLRRIGHSSRHTPCAVTLGRLMPGRSQVRCRLVGGNGTRRVPATLFVLGVCRIRTRACEARRLGSIPGEDTFSSRHTPWALPPIAGHRFADRH
jgi:hypothetical protein